ncbi:hypothetical protein EYF80_017591 [Liparis tanakae]|uniref:Uncharacterized protein n=1 Tax=Liparis tanakae TaxID=230148 RepID=A0A4Z2I4K0_9TELE|nr:hypothetical protein EYF80_017591 [Liparis tanakae]
MFTSLNFWKSLLPSNSEGDKISSDSGRSNTSMFLSSPATVVPSSSSSSSVAYSPVCCKRKRKGLLDERGHLTLLARALPSNHKPASTRTGNVRSRHCVRSAGAHSHMAMAVISADVSGQGWETGHA